LLPPAILTMRLLTLAMAPVLVSAALRTNIAAIVIVASLLKPESASSALRNPGRSAPATISTAMIISATRSTRTFSEMNRTIAATMTVQTMTMSSIRVFRRRRGGLRGRAGGGWRRCYRSGAVLPSAERRTAGQCDGGN